MKAISIFKSAKIYPILDFDFCKDKRISLPDLIRIWEKYPDCISFFQLRAKSLPSSDYANLYFQLKVDFPSANIIVNDFWKFAIEVKSFGLHLGKEDSMSLRESEREKLKSEKLLLKGTSSHCLVDLQNLDTELWHYTGFGPIFRTTTKETSNPVLGVKILQKALKETRISLVPIGGITSENFESLFGFGQITPAAISMMADEKGLVKVVDFIRKHSQIV